MCIVASIVSNSLWPRGLYIAHQAPLFTGILQARVLEWVAMPSSRGSPQPRDQTWSPTLQADALPSEPPGKPHSRGDGVLLQENLCHTYIQSPCPCGRQLQTHTPQEMLKYISVSVFVGSLGLGVHKVCLSPLSVSGRNRV